MAVDKRRPPIICSVKCRCSGPLRTELSLKAKHQIRLRSVRLSVWNNFFCSHASWHPARLKAHSLRPVYLGGIPRSSPCLALPSQQLLTTLPMERSTVGVWPLHPHSHHHHLANEEKLMSRNPVGFWWFVLDTTEDTITQTYPPRLTERPINLRALPLPRPVYPSDKHQVRSLC